MGQLVRCGMQNTVSLRGGPWGPTWQSPGTMTQFAVQVCQRYAPKYTFACNIFVNQHLTGSGAPRSESIIYMIAGGNHTLVSCHVPFGDPQGPRNDMVVFTWLRRFEQPDKLKFEIL